MTARSSWNQGETRGHRSCEKLESSAIPLLASPQGGVSASSRKFREATEADADGVRFPFVLTGKPPRPLLRLRAGALALRGDRRMLRDIFLIARPPLLAVMQGGD